MERIKNLAAMFAAVENVDDLADAMIEGGLVVAELHKLGQIELDDLHIDWIERAKKPVDRPHFDTKLSDFCWQEIFRRYADKTSQRERTVYHITSSVTRETRMQDDFRQQAKRYSMFCDELIEILKTKKTRKGEVEAPVAGRNPINEVADDEVDEAWVEWRNVNKNRRATAKLVAKFIWHQHCDHGKFVSAYKLLWPDGCKEEPTTEDFETIGDAIILSRKRKAGRANYKAEMEESR